MRDKNLVVTDLQNVAQTICKTALNTRRESVDAFRTEALFTES